MLKTEFLENPKFLIAVILLSACIFGMFLSTYFCSDKIREAHNKPFVYRALLPFVAKTTANIIPNKIKHEMKNYIDPFNVVEKSHNYMGNTAMAIMLALIYFSLVGFVYSFICLST